MKTMASSRRSTVAAALLALAASSCYLVRTAAFQPGGFFLRKTTNKHTTSTTSTCDLRPCMSFSSTPKSNRSNNGNNHNNRVLTNAAHALATLVAGTTLLFAGNAAVADGGTTRFSLPPISQAKDRCNFKSSAMGQANAARDSLYDLRECNLSGKSAAGFDLSGVIASEADFSKTDFTEVVMSKSYARNSNWDGADFSNAVVDRVSFDGSSMKGTIFKNAVLTSTSFVGADVENADFTEAYMGEFDQRNLCKNPTLKGTNPVTDMDTRGSVGCPDR